MYRDLFPKKREWLRWWLDRVIYVTIMIHLAETIQMKNTIAIRAIEDKSAGTCPKGKRIFRFWLGRTIFVK